MYQKGQTLIEALVALGAAALVLSAITVAVISALNNVQFAKNQNSAAQYAQQGLELMRQISQSDWAYFSSLTATNYCLNQNNILEEKNITCGQNVGIFVREVAITNNSTDCSSDITVDGKSVPMFYSTLVKVSVSWTDGKCVVGSNTYCHNVILNSCLSNHNTDVVTP